MCRWVLLGGLIVGNCPECEAEIDEEFEDVGEIISCPECGVELEVISVDPLEFDLAPIEDEEEDYGFEDAEEDDEDWDDDSVEDDEDEKEDEY